MSCGRGSGQCRAAARRPRQAAGDRLQHRDLDRRGRAREVAAGTGWRWCRWSSRRPRSPPRSPTAAGSECWRRLTRSRAPPIATRSKGGPGARGDRSRGAGPGAVHPGRLALRRGRARDGPRLLRAAEAGRGRHPDPRLHPLPAGGADAAAHPRSRRAPGQWRPCCRRRCSAHARAQWHRPLAPMARATYRFLCTGDVDSLATSAPASCRCPGRRRAGRDRRRSLSFARSKVSVPAHM